MDIALIGLGRMGANMTRRLLRSGHRCIVYDKNPNPRDVLEREGALPIDALYHLTHALAQPRLVWLMLPAGAPTEATIEELASLLAPGDVVIDGGNSHFKDDIRRSKQLGTRGIRYLDVGVSGGILGLKHGYSLMVGGDHESARLLAPIFGSLAPHASGESTAPLTQGRTPGKSTADQGYYYCGPAGAGHFVKMVHNGIEYGMMQSFAEGFDILRHADSPKLPPEQRYSLDLREISEVWRRGSVVSSWLLDLIADTLNRDPELSQFLGSVEDSGEGRWTVQAAIDEDVPVPVISTSLYVRFRSREERSYAEQMLSAMRSEFGGHAEAKKEAS